MKKISRRRFIHTGLAGVAGLAVAGQGSFDMGLRPEIKVDKVKLGNSGLTVSRIALGTGFRWKFQIIQSDTAWNGKVYCYGSTCL